MLDPVLLDPAPAEPPLPDPMPLDPVLLEPVSPGLALPELMPLLEALAPMAGPVVPDAPALELVPGPFADADADADPGVLAVGELPPAGVDVGAGSGFSLGVGVTLGQVALPEAWSTAFLGLFAALRLAVDDVAVAVPVASPVAVPVALGVTVSVGLAVAVADGVLVGVPLLLVLLGGLVTECSGVALGDALVELACAAGGDELVGHGPGAAP